jgi:hypothetical protein
MIAEEKFKVMGPVSQVGRGTDAVSETMCLIFCILENDIWTHPNNR